MGIPLRIPIHEYKIIIFERFERSLMKKCTELHIFLEHINQLSLLTIHFFCGYRLKIKYLFRVTC